MWKIVFTKAAQKHSIKIAQHRVLKEKVEILLNVIKQDPFQNPPQYEKLVGDYQGLYSRRINVQHRLVYQVFKDQNVIKVLAMWTHYE